MSEDRRPSTRVSLSRAQLEHEVGAELFSLCQGMTADGKLSKDEVVALGLWLHDNRSAAIPGISFLSSVLDRIVADGHVTKDEQRELLEAIEKVLPPDSRKTAKAARRAVDVERKAKAKAAIEAQRKEEAARQERRWPEDEFDFMVAGVHFEGRDRLIKRHLNVGDRVAIVPEPNNQHDDCAVAIALMSGHKIGYVPRMDSEDVTGCIEENEYYGATVKKILTGGRVPIPVVVLQFFRSDQIDDISDLDPRPCPGRKRPQTARGPQSKKPWWKFW